jgi:acetylornithine deacetylase/succinyl-diaminopimelate desuccinylase-like protein
MKTKVYKGRSEIEARNKEISDLLAALVSFESPSGMEQAAMGQLERLFKKFSIPVRIQKVGKRSNLISSVVHNKKPFLSLCSHMDTVPAEGSKLHKMKREVGRLIGLGACDAKASIVAMTLAYRELVKRGIGEHVALAFFVGEEETGDGGMTYIRNGYRPKYAIVGEPTDLALPWGQAGYVHVTFEAQCTPRHAFCLHGPDAMSLVLKAISSIEKITNDFSKGLTPEERPNVFMQQIQGGASDKFWYLRHNCSASLTINIHPTWVPQRFISRVRDATKRLNERKGKAKISLRIESWDPGFEFSSSPLRSAIATAMRVNHLSNESSYMRSWTDAATLMWKGINTVVFGPGSLQHAHSPMEHVLLDEIRVASNVYRDTALELLKLRERNAN